MKKNLVQFALKTLFSADSGLSTTRRSDLGYPDPPLIFKREKKGNFFIILKQKI